MNYLDILFNEPPLVVSPKLAKIIGLNEAIVLQQLHYWLKKSAKIRDNRAWIFNTYREWLEQLPFNSLDTVKRTLAKLVADGVVVKGEFNKASFDKTNWWSIDYEALNTIAQNAYSIGANCTDGAGQIAPMDGGNLHSPIPETNTETNTETNIKKEKPPHKTGFDNLILEHSENLDLANTLRDFIRMRTSIKKPLTDRALKIILAKLKTLAKSDEQQIKLLEQSIFYCWQDIYQDKENQCKFNVTGVTNL